MKTSQEIYSLVQDMTGIIQKPYLSLQFTVSV